MVTWIANRLLLLLLVLQGSDYDTFVKVAQKNEDATFLQTKDKNVAKEAGLKDHGVAVITNFEGKLEASDLPQRSKEQ